MRVILFPNLPVPVYFGGSVKNGEGEVCRILIGRGQEC